MAGDEGSQGHHQMDDHRESYSSLSQQMNDDERNNHQMDQSHEGYLGIEDQMSPSEESPRMSQKLSQQQLLTGSAGNTASQERLK